MCIVLLLLRWNIFRRIQIPNYISIIKVLDQEISQALNNLFLSFVYIFIEHLVLLFVNYFLIVLRELLFNTCMISAQNNIFRFFDTYNLLCFCGPTRPIHRTQIANTTLYFYIHFLTEQNHLFTIILLKFTNSTI